MRRARVATVAIAILTVATSACGSRISTSPAADTAAESRQDPPTDAASPTSARTASEPSAGASIAEQDRPPAVPEPRPAAPAATREADEPASPVPAARTEPPYGQWLLVQSDPAVGEPEGEQTSLAVLVESGRLLVRTDTPCNTGGAELTVDGDRWHLGDFAQTAVGCPEPQSRAENTFHTALTSVTTWRLDDVLTLTGPDVQLVFARTSAG